MEASTHTLSKRTSPGMPPKAARSSRLRTSIPATAQSVPSMTSLSTAVRVVGGGMVLGRPSRTPTLAICVQWHPHRCVQWRPYHATYTQSTPWAPLSMGCFEVNTIRYALAVTRTCATMDRQALTAVAPNSYPLPVAHVSHTSSGSAGCSTVSWEGDGYRKSDIWYLIPDI